MKIIICEQGSPEWRKVRLGIPTASGFDKIITKTLKPSAQAEGYMHQLLAEWIIGEPCDNGGSAFMERGTNMEPHAIGYYEFLKDIPVKRVGFCLRDDGAAGCSPDGLIDPDGGLEIKCPSAAVHIGYWLGSVAEAYKIQVQGSLYITQRDWWDVMSYNPYIDSKIIRVGRDEKFMTIFDVLLTEFLGNLEAAKAKLKAEGIFENMEQFQHDRLNSIL